MASNYYGFTHAGTQYGTEYTAANQYVNPTQQYATSVPNPAFPSAPNPGYTISGYARPVNQAPSTAVFAIPPGAIGPRAPAYPPPTYSANTSGSGTFTGFTPPAAPPKPGGGPSFTNYDAAVYNAVSAYAQGSSSTNTGRGMGYAKRGLGGHMNKKGPRLPPKPQTLHYCDVCKISCAGPQTYKEHLDGQKHKKKEALLKTGGTPTVPKGSPVGLRCELCDVTCTGNDAYAAHLRGAKHQKVLKLHTKLGKPIPSDNPTVIPPASTGSAAPALKKVAVKASAPTFVKPTAPPKVNFVTGKTEFDRFLHTDPAGRKAADAESPSAETLSTSYPASAVGGDTTNVTAVASEDSSKEMDQMYVEKDIEPVGMEYIEEMRTDDGKGVSFNCKLCDCKFNDPNAKEMHMKGRRHRLQYKKKVDPQLVVDIKPSSKQKKLDERMARNRRGFHEGYNRSTNPPMPPLLPPGGPRFGMMPPNMYQPGPPSPGYYDNIPPLIRRGESRDDRHIMAKHAEIYPKEEELQAIQRIVSSTEKALKFVSDEIAEVDSKNANALTSAPAPAVTVGGATIKTENGVEEAPEVVAEEPVDTKPSESDLQAHRVLKGVMRVGNLAKGLLLCGDKCVQLVVLCSMKPTVTLLDRVLQSLPKQLQIVAPDEQYSLSRNVEQSGLSVNAVTEPHIEVKVTFTSPVVRATTGGEATATTLTESEDLLDKEICLDALAALRHAKWFQARATALHSCVIIIRILRDFCNRIPAWKVLTPWVVELLAEKAISSAGVPIGPGESLRLVLEVISSGLFLTPFGPGMMDPCEKDCTDAVGYLTAQQKVDLTQHAQHALRLMTFHQLHKVLDMEELPRFKKGGFGTRKRRRDDSMEVEGEEDSDGKKDKKEGEEVMETTVTASATNGDVTPVV